MDRSIMEGDPHRMLEGMMIAGYAVGAANGYIYVRAEYPMSVSRLRHAIAEMENRNLLGDNILGTDFCFHMHINRGAGAFVCGEGSALTASIEGKRGMPRVKPPRTVEKGLWEKPTVLNNVETFANVPKIILQGADWYRSIGTAGSPGTKTFSLTGAIENTGLIEVPMGSTLREIIYDIGGGLKSGAAFKGVQIGGPSGGCLVTRHLDVNLDFDSLKKMGAMIGSGGLVVMDDHTCMVEVARFFMNFTQNESCGKCVPCRVGLWQLKNLLTDVMNGDATMETLDLMEELSVSIMEGADCAIGYEAAHMVYKSLMGCREDYEEHVRQGRCTCQYTQPVPCVSLCPAHVDIPGYIALVGEGRYADAIRLIRKDNPFPTTCGFICEHPCEARCRRNIVDDAVNIRGLKRMAADYAGKVPPPPCAPSTGKRIAVVGGGPGGLSAAYYLQLMGHQTTVFEMLPELGGMLRYGIPNYRLPKGRLNDDINAILETGVKVEFGKRIGKDMTIQSLREEYDAVLITIGASTDKKLGIEGEHSEGVLSAVQFLRDVGKNQNPDLTGQEVAVIGGGNVSMDAVRTAKRLGAKKVSIVYRRRVADMTALPAEIEGAVAEGIEVQTLMAPSRIETDENGHVKGIYVTPQMISKIKDGRASVRPTGAPDVFIPCQTLIVAIGQDIEYQHFEEAGVPVQRGKILTEKYGGFDNIPGVFAGGDCASGPASVIKAIAAAKVVAANIDEYLGYHHIISCDVEIPEARLDDRPPCGRVNMTEREACERVCDFNGVENCMSEAEAKQEASRCLRCDHFGYGIFKGGRKTLW